MSNRRHRRPVASTILGRRIELIAQVRGERYMHGHEPSTRLRSQIAALRGRVLAGQSSTCPHLRPSMAGAVAL
jgi:hypothetical protein